MKRLIKYVVKELWPWAHEGQGFFLIEVETLKVEANFHEVRAECRVCHDGHTLLVDRETRERGKEAWCDLVERFLLEKLPLHRHRKLNAAEKEEIRVRLLHRRGAWKL